MPKNTIAIDQEVAIIVPSINFVPADQTERCMDSSANLQLSNSTQTLLSLYPTHQLEK